ncbi:hypothetical protein EXIGLDRAFT_838375 [Exidia glandulosa HHB12029]|uniref:BTB domain-containing protein n=1 Tax=Exidia glandulosa HHB12029 TaxID=1314781 RepID=A0A165FX81_EXIGL|nr:hypothetical protein EXIGLDRAFT_838375 [Exidia glandulosa HHB12029]
MSTGPDVEPLCAPQDVTTRDSQYYKADGNVVLRAEDVLFQAHRSALSELSPVLKNMLELPQGVEATGEGCGDSCPVVLAGDTAEEVRSLLWAVYSRADEVALYLKTTAFNAQCLRLLQVVVLAHKYDVPQLMQWAFTTVRSQSKAHPRFTPPVATTTYLVRLHSLKVPGATLWADGIIKTAYTGNGSGLLSVTRVLAPGAWTSLEHWLYYRLLCLGTNSWKTLSLTDSERTRLLAGYHNLRELWAKISTERLRMGHHCPTDVRATCSANCLKLWLELCSASAGATPTAFVDLTGRMRWISTALASFIRKRQSVLSFHDQVMGVTQPKPALSSFAEAILKSIHCLQDFMTAAEAVERDIEKNALRCLDPTIGLIDHTSCTLPL